MEMKQRTFMTKDYLDLLITIILEIIILLIGFDIVKSKLIIVPISIYYLLGTIIIMIGLLFLIQYLIIKIQRFRILHL